VVNILRVSEAASLAMHAVTFLAARNDRPYSTKEIAENFSVSEAHLSKVLQRLAKCHMVRSIRGPKGGFTFDGEDESISLLDVYRCIEGDVPICDCLLASPVCTGQGCLFGGLPAAVSSQFRNYLESTKITELTHLWEEE
jgi:Rrf2 family protein